MTKLKICLWLTVTAAAFFGNSLSHAQVPYQAESRAITSTFATRLQSELKAAMSKGGPTAAIGVCKDVATQIASEASRESGAKVSRVSLRTRNPANTPEPWQQAVLHEFDAAAAGGKSDGPLEFLATGPGGSVRYMKAIPTAPVCLACHGSALSADVRTLLDEHYPFDRARGYDVGDIRGAFSVTWPLPVEERAADEPVHAISSSDFSEPQVWGQLKNVVKVKHIYISGQPDEAALKEARDHGVGAVINLRGPDEIDWDEESAAGKLGLEYYNVPVQSHEGFDARAIEQVTALVRQYGNENILLHCSSGNRVSGWLAIHMVQDHDMPVDTAIEMAKHASLTKPKVETAVREFLNQ